MTPQYYICTRCGWVHFRISREEALATGAASLASYLRCFRCGAPTSECRPAHPGEGPPMLANVGPIVIEEE